jgi:hypothetical protein
MLWITWESRPAISFRFDENPGRVGGIMCREEAHEEEK